MGSFTLRPPRRGKKKYIRNLFRSPFRPPDCKWSRVHDQHQALQMLKQAAKLPEQPDSGEPYLLSALDGCFRACRCPPTPRAYHFVLKTLAWTSQFHHIPSVLDRLQRVEKFRSPEFLFAYLIKVYAQMNRVQDAVALFRRIPAFGCVPSSRSLNPLLFLLCKNDETRRMVPEIVLDSQAMGVWLDESAWQMVIIALCKMDRIGHAMEIFEGITEEYGLNPGICSFMLSSLCKRKSSSGSEVLGFLVKMIQKGFCPGALDYYRVIKCLVRRGMGSDARDVFEKMKLDGFKPDIVSYSMVLNGVIEEGDYETADKLFDELLLFGLVPDVCTYNVYIHGLCKRGDLEAGIQMVSYMEEIGCKPNVDTYNVLLEALCKTGRLGEARKLRREMQLKGLAENLWTFRIMIDGLFNDGDVIEACVMLQEMLGGCFPPQISTFNEILSWLCQKDMVSKALELLALMVGKNFSPGARAWEILLLSSGNELTSDKSLETTLGDLVGV